MLLQQSSIATLLPVQALINQLNDEQYSKPLTVLSGSSIGKHLRHILEFYECLFKGLVEHSVDYEARERNLRLENDRSYAIQVIQHLIQNLNSFQEDSTIHLHVKMEHDELSISIPTTFYRELAYNIEHCIHHLAIIRIAVQTHFPKILLPEHFGVAYSTLRFQKAGKN
jgi:hypothetical protein